MLLSKHVAFLQNKDVLRSSAARFFPFGYGCVSNFFIILRVFYLTS